MPKIYAKTHIPNYEFNNDYCNISARLLLEQLFLRDTAGGAVGTLLLVYLLPLVPEIVWQGH